MPITYDSIATNTTTGSTASFDFTSIPSSYTDLRLVIYHTVVTGAGSLYLRFNNDSTTTYSFANIEANNTAYASTLGTDNQYIWTATTNNANSTNPALVTLDIFEYSDNKFKTVLSDVASARDATNSYLYKNVNMWRSTIAISSIQIAANNFNFAAGTVATLYGILRA
jgi:hypothetical protein